MRVSITARHMELTDGIKVHVQQSLDKLVQHFDKLIDADVVLSTEKHRHVADITLHANGLRIHGKDATEDMYVSIDKVASKLDRQILRFKEKIKKFKPREIAQAMDYGHSQIEIDHEAEHDESVEVTDRHRVVHHEKLTMRPMSVDEATMQLELTEDPFLVFANADTQKVNVLYRHNDGTYGLIEPQF